MALARWRPASLQNDDAIVTLMIEQALTDPNIAVRRHTTVGLDGSCHDVRTVRTLEALLERETDPAICRNARWALRRQHALAAHHAVGPGHAPPAPAVGSLD